MLKTAVKGLITENGQVKGVVAKHLGKTWEIPAKIVIAADGIESNMAQFYGLENRFKPKDICSCAQFEMVGLDVNCEMMKFYFGQKIAPGGYAWIFPKGDNRANVGLGIRSSQGTAYHYLQKFAENLGGKKVEFNVGAVPYRWTDSKNLWKWPNSCGRCCWTGRSRDGWWNSCFCRMC